MKRRPLLCSLSSIAALLFVFWAAGTTAYSQSTATTTQNALLVIDITDHYFSVNQSSADSLKDSLERLGHTVVMTDQMPSSISTDEYTAVFCCAGMFPANGILSDADIQVLSTYLSSGGRLYLEGGDVWYYDPIMYSTGQIESVFGINSSYDGNYLGDIRKVSGVPGNFMEGITFTYEGFVNFTDFLYLDWENCTDAFNIWDNEIDYQNGSDPFMFPAGVARNVSGGYKTIGTCFEFSGIPCQEKDSVLSRYLDFFLSGSVGKPTDCSAKVSVPEEKSGRCDALSPRERALNHRYPKLFNEYTGVLATEERIDSLSFWDFIILNTWNLINKPDAFGPSGTIRQNNQDCLIFIYFSAADYSPYSAVKLDCGFQSVFRDSWLIKDVNGDSLKFFHLPDGKWTYAMDLSTQVNQILPYYLNKHILATGRVDGIYYDWITEGISWVNYDDQNPSGPIDIDSDGIADSDQKIDQMWVQGTKALLTNSKAIFSDSSIIIGNGGSYFDDTYKGLLQGRMNEGLYSALGWYDWHTIVRGHYLMHKDAAKPKLSMIQFTGDKIDYQRMRFGLSTALLLGAYYQYTSAGTYHSTWWYDEYAVNRDTGKAEWSIDCKGYLGEPLNQPYNAKNAQEKLADLLDADDSKSNSILWRRDFQYGTVFCNPSSQPISLSFEEVKGTRNTDNIYRINGTQDRSVNNGQKVQSGLTIGAQDGLILLVDFIGTEVQEEMDSGYPTTYELENVFPNPFNSSAEIRYSLPKKTEVQILVINMRGEQIETIFQGVQPAGRYSAHWDASEAPSGVYLIQLLTEKQRLSKKCLLVK